ncbi:MAG: alkaline phosphatase family protein [Candidatus Methanomethylicus sp.]|nr:alkaline phosphatase family protein [Candidatus Methanomethylicus sp.]
MRDPQPRRVLVIALDSAEPTLIEKWMNDGTLPHLKSLRSRGAYGRLKSSAEWLGGSPWPTFYTGTSPAMHGLYEINQWHPRLMKHVQTSNEWLPLTPFWRKFSENGPRVISIDLPMTYPAECINGIEICGWMTHDSIGNMGRTVSFPPGEISHFKGDFNLKPVPITLDKFGIQSVRSLLGLRDQLILATENLAGLAEKLMDCERWDLFMVSFASPHRGGHKLWDFSGAIGRASARERREFSEALHDVYIACDKGVGQLVDRAGNNAAALVFSLHGMRPNKDRAYLMPKMLNSILKSKVNLASQSAKDHSIIEWIKVNGALWLPLAFPTSSFAYKVAFKIYHTLNGSNAQTTFSSPAFSIDSCLNGHIRINLRGREKDGTVEPGKAYDQLCSAIIEDLKTFVDADTGKPIVEQAVRSDRLYGLGRRIDFLPDIVVKWAPTPAIYNRRVISDRYPSISIAMPPRHHNGRSGNHSPQGFLLAVGERIQPTLNFDGGDILDLTPTILELLGIEKPVEMQGKSLLSGKNR